MYREACRGYVFAGITATAVAGSDDVALAPGRMWKLVERCAYVDADPPRGRLEPRGWPLLPDVGSSHCSQVENAQGFGTTAPLSLRASQGHSGVLRIPVSLHPDERSRALAVELTRRLHRKRLGRCGRPGGELVLASTEALFLDPFAALWKGAQAA